MPKVIANKLTLETIPDNAANRIKTFREEFKGNYREYCKKYETITFGECYDRSKLVDIEKYGLLDAHKEHIKETKKSIEDVKNDKIRALKNEIGQLPRTELKSRLLELYNRLDSYSQGEAISTIESFEDDRDYCNSYR
jgi:hypothetical protein